MTLWYTYRNRIYQNSYCTAAEKHGFEYLSNKLFAEILIYLFPFATCAAVFGVLYFIHTHILSMATTMIGGWLLICITCFSRPISVEARKLLLVSTFYLVACSLFFHLGTRGPGMMYFLVFTILTVLIFPKYKGYYSVMANAVFCLFVCAIIYFDLLDTPIKTQYGLSAWIIISINLIAYSLLMVILIPRLFYRLEKSNTRYEAVSKATTDTIWDCDLTEHTCTYNTNLYHTFGYSREDISNTEEWAYSLMHPEDRELVEYKFKQAIEGDDKCSVKYRMRCKDGSYKYVLCRAIVLREKGGAPVRIIGAIEDITRIKEYISEIEDQNSRLRQIAWLQSHKVRSPVATILGLAQLYDEGAKECTEDNQIVLKGIVASCKELDSIIHEINDLTKHIPSNPAITSLIQE